MFCSPELGTMIADEIGRHKLVRTLREEAHMGHTTIAKLKRGNWVCTQWCVSWPPCACAPIRKRWKSLSSTLYAVCLIGRMGNWGECWRGSSYWLLLSFHLLKMRFHSLFRPVMMWTVVLLLPRKRVFKDKVSYKEFAQQIADEWAIWSDTFRLSSPCFRHGI